MTAFPLFCGHPGHWKPGHSSSVQQMAHMQGVCLLNCNEMTCPLLRKGQVVMSKTWCQTSCLSQVQCSTLTAGCASSVQSVTHAECLRNLHPRKCLILKMRSVGNVKSLVVMFTSSWLSCQCSSEPLEPAFFPPNKQPLLLTIICFSRIHTNFVI